MPAFEFALPPGAKNIKIKTGTQEIAVEPTYYRHSKDGAIPIIALFGGDEFVGEVKEGHWKLEEREDGMGAWRISNGKMEFELASDEAGTTRRLRVDSNSKILLIDGTEIQVELSSPVATLANNATWFSFLLGSERQWNPQNAVLVRIKIDTSGVQFQVYSRIDNGAWTERYASTKGTTNLNVVFKIILDGSTLRVYSKEGSATEFTERWNHANWLPNLVYPIFRSMSNSTDKQTFTCDFVRVTYPNFKVVYDLDDDAYQGDGELLKKAWDTSGNGNHGVVHSATWVRDGKFGKALSFDGDGYVEIPDSNSLDLTSQGTIAFWLNPSRLNYGTRQHIIQKSGAYEVYIYENTKKIAARKENPTEIAYSDELPSTNQWYHIAVVYDHATENKIKIYINGTLSGTPADMTSDISTSTNPLFLGVWQGEANFLEGILDEVLIFNRALSEAEIQTLYNGGTVTDGLVGEWKFDGGNDRGEVKVYDTRGSSDEDDWVRVYDPSHKFVGDCVIENGLIRFRVSEATYQGATLSIYNGEWQGVSALNFVLRSPSTKVVNYPFLQSIEYLSTEEARVKIRIRDSSVADEDHFIDVKVIVKRGRYSTELKLLRTSGNSDCFFGNHMIFTASWAYSGDGKIEDKSLGVSGDNTSMSDNFIVAFDETTQLLYITSAQKKPDMCFETSLDNYVGFNDFTTSHRDSNVLSGAVPFNKVANLFMEAEA